MRAFGLGLGLCLLASDAFAQIETQVDVKPDWLKRPTGADIRGVWPASALKSGRGGQTVIHCKVSAQGALFGCSVLSESPVGSGFGQAALTLTPQMLFKPAIKNGAPVAFDGVTIPIKFDPPGFGGSDENIKVVTIGRWENTPSYDDVVMAYPKKAELAKIGGHVTLSCTFSNSGRLHACGTLAVEPRGQGFLESAMALSKKFQAPKDVDGKSIEGYVTHLAFTFAPQMLTDTDKVIGHMRLMALPDAEALQKAFPSGAVDVDFNTVRVVLNCQVLQGGKVSDCKVQSESPPDHGFGEGAIALSTGLQVSTWTQEGLPIVGGRVMIPIRYELGPKSEAQK